MRGSRVPPPSSFPLRGAPIHCLRSARSSLGSVGLCHRREIWPDSPNGLRLFSFRGRRGSLSRGSRSLQLSTNSPKPLTRTLVCILFDYYIFFFFFFYCFNYLRFKESYCCNMMEVLCLVLPLWINSCDLWVIISLIGVIQCLCLKWAYF